MLIVFNDIFRVMFDFLLLLPDKKTYNFLLQVHQQLADVSCPVNSVRQHDYQQSATDQAASPGTARRLQYPSVV